MSRSIVKSVRLEEELVDQVMRALADEKDFDYRPPTFSDATRYGLILVLAALGIEPAYSQGSPITAVESWRKISKLEDARRDLLNK